MTSDYAELSAISNFSFLHGASHPHELVTQAGLLQLKALAITDLSSLAGVVRAHVANRELASALKLIIGARLDIYSYHGAGEQPLQLTALVCSLEGYQALCRMLSRGKMRCEKGKTELYYSDLADFNEGLIFLPHAPDVLFTSPDEIESFEFKLEQARQSLDIVDYLLVSPLYDGQDDERIAKSDAFATRLNLTMLASNCPVMHARERRSLADILTCIRLGVTIDKLAEKAYRHSEHCLKSGEEMSEIFAGFPHALSETIRLADQCQFSLDELSYQYPLGESDEGETTHEKLTRLAHAGILQRYNGKPTDLAMGLLVRELAIIAELKLSNYFLTVQEIVSFADSREILCQGRGSAANSVVCFALGITKVYPERISMVFERFISEARNEPPDIDIDFEHERREEVIQFVYEKYGRHRAGLCSTVISYRSRSAIREVGKAMGLSEDMTAVLSSQMSGWSSRRPVDTVIKEIGLDLGDYRLAVTMRLVAELIGFPRHLSQHVGGLVITEKRLDELCPIENARMENRTVIEWDKDDIDALGILKVDLLSLGMLTCIRKAFQYIEQLHNRKYELYDLAVADDPTVYDMLCRGDSLGVFQIESRAQMNFLPRMKPRNFYDLVIEIAIVRPGPIQGKMVHPYIRRRNGLEKVSYPSAELEGVLKKTLGVPIFQEQAMQIAVVGAGFSAIDADRLRRSMASFRKMGNFDALKTKFLDGMSSRGYEDEFAQLCFKQIEGFGSYGFPESHAASFALLAFVSSWIKCYHPAIFACALLNSQPMGFYAPAQIISDLRRHKVNVLPISINHSSWDNSLEYDNDGAVALRLGMRRIKGLAQAQALMIEKNRGNGYSSIEAIYSETGLSRRSLELLADADAFSCLNIDRATANWQILALVSRPEGLFEMVDVPYDCHDGASDLPLFNVRQNVRKDYQSMQLSLRGHPVEFLRDRLEATHPIGAGYRKLSSANPEAQDVGFRYEFFGLVTVRQRPGTAKGVIFLTLEDEVGFINVVVWKNVYERYRREIMTGRLLRISGEIQREGLVVHLIANKVEDFTSMLDCLQMSDEEWQTSLAAAAEKPHVVAPLGESGGSYRHPRTENIRLFSSRDFH